LILDWLDTRKRLGDPFVMGTGVEIGAGLHPVRHDGIRKLYFFDKRNPEEFEAYFGAPPEYDLIDLEGVRREYPDGLDFISCHHVVEHIDNPVAVLADWISMIRQGGTFYLSIPSQNNSIEHGRLLTPLQHVLEDYFFQRPASSYESKQHINSFIEACTASGGPVRPWFADNTTQDYARYILFDIGQRDDHDLHWHTYDLQTIRGVVEAAFYVAGASAEILVCEESDDSHYIAARKAPRGHIPSGIAAFYAQTRAALDRCHSLIAGDRPA
jgi:SAM-dependent methyltransferase